MASSWSPAAPPSASASLCHSGPAATSVEGAHPGLMSQYLHRRRYSWPHAATGGGAASVAELALSQILDTATSSENAVHLACIDANALQWEQQYSKFKLWISESADSFKPELAQLLFPMFTHLYLELVINGLLPFAQKFHKKHQSTFLGNAEFAAYIKQLQVVQSTDDIQRNATVNAFMACKYSVTLSNRTFHYLMQYIRGCAHPILLHILRGKIDLKLADALGAGSKAEGIKRIHHERLLRDEPTQDTNAPDAKFNEIQQVEDTIQAVRSGSAPLPSVCLYRLTSTQSHFTASTISRDARLLGAASEHAGLWAWPLQPPQTGLTVKDEDGPDLVQPATRDIETTGGDESACSRLIGHTGVVYDCAFVPHRTAVAGDPLSNFLLSVGEDTTMRLWDLKTQQNRAVFRGHSYPIWSLDIDRLGINIATGSMDCTAKLWDIEHTFPLRIYAGHERDVDVVQFHPNCNYLATGSLDRSIRLWSHADAQMVRVFSGHRGSIFSLAFSPDGAFLASGGEDHDVRVWDLASASLLKELKGHTEAIYALIWSPDSSMLTSGSLDGSIRHWDIKGPIRSPSDGFGPGMSSELVAAYQTHVSIQSLSYSPHNTLIATGVRAPIGPMDGTASDHTVRMPGFVNGETPS